MERIDLSFTINYNDGYVLRSARAQNISVSEAGKYTVRITDANGCQATADSVEIIVHDVRPEISCPDGLIIICYGSPITLSLAPHTGNIQWYKDDVPFATGTNIPVTEIGTYRAVLDTLNCLFEAPVVQVISNNAVTPPAKITPSHPILCAGGNVMLTADEASKYLWSTGDNTQSIWVNAPGTYTLTVEDEFGCPSTVSFEMEEVEVTLLPEIEVVAGQLALCPETSVNTGGVDLHEATLRASDGVVFEWNNGATTQEITVVYADAGFYSVVAYDANGCAVPAEPVEILAVTEIVPEIDAGISVICGSEPHALFVSPINETFTYEWSNGDTDYFANVSEAGNYSVTIVTAEGCRFVSDLVTVTQAPAPDKPVISANFVIVNDTLKICPNQVYDVELTSTEAKAYFWNTGDITRSILIPDIGKYALTVEYANGCTAVSDTVVVILADAAVYIETEDDKTQLCPDGNIILNASGAEEGSVFEWYRNDILLSGEILSSYTASSVGSYHVKVTGPGGCIETAYPLEITNYPVTPLEISSGGSLDICPYDSVYLIVSHGATYQWTWITGEGNENIGDSQYIYASKAGNYQVAVTDEFGCVQEAAAEVTVKPQYAPVIEAAQDTICQGNTLMLSVPAPEGSTFMWNTGETSQSVTFDDPFRFGNQAYRVEVTYPEGCTFRSPVKNIYVNISPRQPAIDVVGSNHVCPDRTVVLITNSSSDYTYQWRWETSPGVWENYNEAQGEGRSYWIVVEGNGNYDVSITDKNGCSSRSEVFELENLSSATVEIFPKGTISICESGGFVKLEAMMDDVLYMWMPTGETTKSIIVTQEGYYRVTVTQVLEDDITCSITSQRVEVRNASLLPAPSISAMGSVNFCEGAQVTLSSSISPNGRYEWIRWTETDTTVVNVTREIEVTQSGEYMMVFSDENNCKVFSNIIRVTAYPLPEAVISPAGTFTVCEGGYITLCANEGLGYTYQWSAPGNAVTREIEASTGTHTVTVTTPQGCSATSAPVEIRQSASQAPMPDANDASVGEGEKATLTAASEIDDPEFFWWDAATDGNLIGFGDVFETPPLFGEYKVWVSAASETLCESPRREVTVIITTTQTGPIYRVPNDY